MLATLIGFSAILMWSLLALLTAASGAVPPFQLAAICFGIGTLIGVAALLRDPSRLAGLRQPWPVWLVGIAGLFGYHFFYFTALRNAPAVQAGLIAYMWPLLIVVGSALLPGERLGWHHVVGALMGLGGTVLILTGAGADVQIAANPVLGYGAAILCALTWSSYSLLSRRFGKVPTDVVTGFCAAAAILAALAHLALEITVWPANTTQWLAVVGLGLGPVGAAFYTWDIGMKRGDIQVLGALSYSAPLLSTLVLILFGYGEPSLSILLACLLITGGAALAAKNLLMRKKVPA